MPSYHKPISSRILITSVEVTMFLGIKAALQPIGLGNSPDYASTVDDAIVKLRQTHYEVLIWCVPVKTREMLHSVARLKLQSPATKILIMGNAFTYANILAAMRAGATGYIPRSFPFEELTDFFREVFYKERTTQTDKVQIFNLERDGLFG